MKICGVEIKGSDAAFAVANLEDGSAVTHIQLPTRKITLADDDASENVKSFSTLLKGFVRDNEITHIAIKKRNKKGEYAGGPNTFKIEGILQLLADCEVTLVSPVSIASQIKKYPLDLPDSLLKYQEEAFKTAYAVCIKGSV